MAVKNREMCSECIDLKLRKAKGGVQSFTHPIASLQSRLQDHITGGEIDAALALLRDWCSEHRPLLAPELKKAGEAMLAAKGTLPVNSIAEEAHTTVRTLERKFKVRSGHIQLGLIKSI